MGIRDDLYGPGPTAKRGGLAQAGNGGPYIIVSNPWGAIVDTFRAICFPTPMEQDDSGNVTDLGGYGADVTGSSLDYLPMGGGYGGYGGGGYETGSSGDNDGSRYCGTGSHWDSVAAQCVPDTTPPTSNPDTCSTANLQSATASLRTAIANMDSAGAQMIADSANICAANAKGTALKASWKALSLAAQKAASEMGKQSSGCDEATRAGVNQQIAAAIRNCDDSVLGSLIQQAATCWQSSKGNQKARWKTTYDKARDAQKKIVKCMSQQEKQGKTGMAAADTIRAKDMMGQVNSMDIMPIELHAPSSFIGNMNFGVPDGVMPREATYLTTTEGNPRMQKYREPFGGHIDPGKHIPLGNRSRPRRV